MTETTKPGTVEHAATHDIGSAARQRRRSLGLTQDELADLAQCSPRFIRELETNKPTVRLDKVLDVLTALGLELTVNRRTTS